VCRQGVYGGVPGRCTYWVRENGPKEGLYATRYTPERYMATGILPSLARSPSRVTASLPGFLAQEGLRASVFKGDLRPKDGLRASVFKEN